MDIKILFNWGTSNLVYSSQHLVQRGVFLGTLTFKTGPQKAVLPLLVKMELSLAAATISPTLLSLW